MRRLRFFDRHFTSSMAKIIAATTAATTRVGPVTITIRQRLLWQAALLPDDDLA